MPHAGVPAPRATRIPSISCVLPAYNEGQNLAQVVPQVLASLHALSPQVEVLVVDDGSRDDTAAVARALCAAHPGVVLIELSRNFGKEAALTAGLDAARGEVVVLMDADGQHPAALLPQMLEKWQQGSDVVYAVRRTRDDQSPLHARLAHLFYRLVNWGSRVAIPADAGDFRWMDRKVVDALKALPERNRFMKGLYAWVGFQSTALDYLPLPRTQGHSSFGLRGAFSLALTGMVAFSSTPLRALSLLGLLLSMASLAYGLWVVLEYFWLGIEVPGYATLAAGMMFLSGIQLLSIGVLAEYVGRIYEEVKRRPSYLVSERSGAGLAQDGADRPSA
ncbi:glycosyltransferase [Rhodococcus sp. SRB_17]|nr:glycosyltransferase [Rhodococcus sp. SRB_17]